MKSLDVPCEVEELPGLDERLVAPDTRYEILDGELVYVPPADRRYGTRHAKVVTLVVAHVADGFEVACDMLTRVSKASDIAQDVSVYPCAPDPVTGGRQLEQVSFELVNRGSISHAGRKAAQLKRRGVRRVFAIDVEGSRALEWSSTAAAWLPVDPGAVLEDPVFAVALPVAALLENARTHKAVARALLAKHNPIVEATRADARAKGAREAQARLEEGALQGRIAALLVVLEGSAIALRPEDRARIAAERDPARLDRWLARAASCTSVAELFAIP
jgi:hypothetical protein